MTAGGDALKLRELNHLTHALARAIAARTKARQAWKRAEERVREIRRQIRAVVADPPPGPPVLCDECRQPLGTTATCLECQAAHALFLGGYDPRANARGRRGRR